MQEHKDEKNLIEKGFTLIELLVVIAILGILAAVVVFAVGGITDRGQDQRVQDRGSHDADRDRGVLRRRTVPTRRRSRRWRRTSSRS